MHSYWNARNKPGYLRAQLLRVTICQIMITWPGGVLGDPCTASAVRERLRLDGYSPLPSIRTVRIHMEDIRAERAAVPRNSLLR